MARLVTELMETDELVSEVKVFVVDGLVNKLMVQVGCGLMVIVHVAGGLVIGLMVHKVSE